MILKRNQHESLPSTDTTAVSFATSTPFSLHRISRHSWTHTHAKPTPQQNKTPKHIHIHTQGHCAEESKTKKTAPIKKGFGERENTDGNLLFTRHDGYVGELEGAVNDGDGRVNRGRKATPMPRCFRFRLSAAVNRGRCYPTASAPLSSHDEQGVCTRDCPGRAHASLPRPASPLSTEPVGGALHQRENESRACARSPTLPRARGLLRVAAAAATALPENRCPGAATPPTGKRSYLRRGPAPWRGTPRPTDHASRLPVGCSARRRRGASPYGH